MFLADADYCKKCDCSTWWISSSSSSYSAAISSLLTSRVERNVFKNNWCSTFISTNSHKLYFLCSNAKSELNKYVKTEKEAQSCKLQLCRKDPILPSSCRWCNYRATQTSMNKPTCVSAKIKLSFIADCVCLTYAFQSCFPTFQITSNFSKPNKPTFYSKFKITFAIVVLPRAFQIWQLWSLCRSARAQQYRGFRWHAFESFYKFYWLHFYMLDKLNFDLWWQWK